MSFWSKFKEFDKMMDQPAIIIETEKKVEIDDNILLENQKLKQLLKHQSGGLKELFRKPQRTIGKKERTIEVEYKNE